MSHVRSVLRIACHTASCQKADRLAIRANANGGLDVSFRIFYVRDGGEYMAKNEALFPILNSPGLSTLARAAAAAPLHSTGCLTE
jgi:hypothetical protein